MFREDKLPLVDFYQLWLENSSKLGYEIIICLIARYSDTPEIYENLERQWSSLHDVTGKSFLFLFAGDNVNDYVDSGKVLYRNFCRGSRDEATIYSDTLAILPSPNNNLLKLNELASLYLKKLQKGQPRLEKDSDIRNSHTIQISQLKEYLKIQEKDIPCLHIYHLKPKITTIVSLDANSDIYQLLKFIQEKFESTSILVEIKKYFNEVNRINYHINNLKSSKRTNLKSKIDYHQEKLNKQQKNLDIQIANYTEIIEKCSQAFSERIQVKQEQSMIDDKLLGQRNINTGGGNYNERIEGNYYQNVVNNYHNSQNEGIPSLRQGMPYEQARKILIDAGWQATFNRFPVAATEAQTDLIFNHKGWVELESCSGTGLGLCTFQFRNATGQILRIVTANNSPEPNSSELNSIVFQWFLVKEEEDNL